MRKWPWVGSEPGQVKFEDWMSTPRGAGPGTVFAPKAGGEDFVDRENGNDDGEIGKENGEGEGK